MSRSSAEITEAMQSLERAYLIGVPDVTEVWLVRHADVYDGLSDAQDPGLTPRGQEQARLLADRVHRVGASAVYASPLRRALDTAHAITKAVDVDPRLAEAAAHFAGGRLTVDEPRQLVADRMAAAVDAAVGTHPGVRVVLVGHGVAILSYLCLVLRLAPGSLRLYPACASISVVRAKDNRRAAGALGDVAHLETLAP